jgi:hypothetical protein
VIIPSRYNGPPDTANGGYAAGMLATYLDSPTGAIVTLRRPPPLRTPLDVRTEPDGIALYDGARLIAQAAPVPADDPPLEWVAPVGLAEAMDAAQRYQGFVEHPFPTCFVCGPRRPPGDGLRLFPGRLPDGRSAAPWVVPDDIEPALMWAALDCPGGWSVGVATRPYLLGRLTARVQALPAPGEGCVVVGTAAGTDGRKAFTRSSVYGQDGAPLATGRAVWIEVRRS